MNLFVAVIILVVAITFAILMYGTRQAQKALEDREDYEFFGEDEYDDDSDDDEYLIYPDRYDPATINNFYDIDVEDE